MCAAFFCVPLYVVIVTSFKTMEQIRSARSSRCPSAGRSSPGGRRGTRPAPASAATASRAASGTRWRSCSRAWSCRSALVGHRLCAGAVERALGEHLPLRPLHLRLRAVPDHHDPADRGASRRSGVYGTIWGIAIVHAVLAMPLLTLIFRNYYKDIPQEIISAAIMDSGSFWRIFFEIILPMSANIMIVVLILQITSIWNDYPDRPHLRRHRRAADDRDPRQLRRSPRAARSPTTSTWRRRCSPPSRRSSSISCSASSSSRASPPARSRGSQQQNLNQPSPTTVQREDDKMLHQRLKGMALALAFGALPFVANAAELTLFHTWSNESEMAALNTIVNAFEAKGNTITAASVPHETGRREPARLALRRRHAAEPLHRRGGQLLPRPQSQGPSRRCRPAVRQDRRDRRLPENRARRDHHRRRGAENPDRRPHRRHDLLQQEGRRGGRRRSDQMDSRSTTCGRTRRR